MKLIRINRKSIRKNPDYGKEGQRTFMPGSESTGIIYIGEPPKEKLKDCIILSKESVSDESAVYVLAFNGPLERAIKLFGKDKKATVTCERNQIETTCKDYGPEFYYEYQNPFIECTACGKSSRVKDIKRDNDEGYEYDYCPHCHETDSFEPYKFEAFQDRNMN